MNKLAKLHFSVVLKDTFGSFLPILIWGLGFLIICSNYDQTWGHFNTKFGKRIIHVEHSASGITLYIRSHLPKTLIINSPEQDEPDGSSETGLGKRLPEKNGAVADSRRSANDHKFELPGVMGERLDEPVKFASLTEAEEAAPVFAALLADGLIIKVADYYPDFVVKAARVHATPFAPDFGTLQDARSSLERPMAKSPAPESYEGDVTVDISLFYPTPGDNYKFEYSTRIETDEDVQTILNNNIGSRSYYYQFSGDTTEPILIEPSWYQTGQTFIVEGVKHILGGLDHVLFVLVLIVGAPALRPLILTTTGFTLGHSVTLISGAMGFSPPGQWFIPVIEILIALSIIYAGVIAAFQTGERITIWLAVIIGLVHGYGFSFALGELLELQGTDLIAKMIYFNIGVEIGQALIIVAVWPLFMYLKRHFLLVRRFGNLVVALPCVLIACYWFVERAMKLL